MRVSLAMALVALLIVAVAENGRIPVDNPATHLELTMVHEAMVLEYSGRHLAMIELAASLKLMLYLSMIACIFFPFGMAADAGQAAARTRRRRALGWRRWRVGGVALGVFGDVGGEDAGVPRAELPRRRADAGVAGRAAAVRLQGHVMRVSTHGLAFDIAHMLAGLLVLVSFMMLYQVRLQALLHVLALHAFVLALSVAWQAHIQDAPHLYITAAMALAFKAIADPLGAAPHGVPDGPAPGDRDGGRHRPDHARRHRAGGAVAGGDAAGDRAMPIRWRARISRWRCRWC